MVQATVHHFSKSGQTKNQLGSHAMVVVFFLDIDPSVVGVMIWRWKGTLRWTLAFLLLNPSQAQISNGFKI